MQDRDELLAQLEAERTSVRSRSADGYVVIVDVWMRSNRVEPDTEVIGPLDEQVAKRVKSLVIQKLSDRYSRVEVRTAPIRTVSSVLS